MCVQVVVGGRLIDEREESVSPAAEAVPLSLPHRHTLLQLWIKVCTHMDAHLGAAQSCRSSVEQ